MIQVRNQQDLDHVIQLHEGTGPRHRMRLILSQVMLKEKFLKKNLETGTTI